MGVTRVALTAGIHVFGYCTAYQSLGNPKLKPQWIRTRATRIYPITMYVPQDVGWPHCQPAVSVDGGQDRTSSPNCLASIHDLDRSLPTSPLLHPQIRRYQEDQEAVFQNPTRFPRGFKACLCPRRWRSHQRFYGDCAFCLFVLAAGQRCP